MERVSLQMVKHLHETQEANGKTILDITCMLLIKGDFLEEVIHLGREGGQVEGRG